MDLISILVIVLSIIYLIYIVLETITLKALRKRFLYVIHVNGIRGKSTTVRLIDEGLRSAGYKVYSKTTGTLPFIINTKGEEVPIKRLGSANIREQIKYMYKAYKEGAEILVFECMAVNKELQRISEEKILKADITIITNVRRDHFGEMGDSMDELALALSSTIPKNGTLITREKEYSELFSDKCRKNKTKFIEALDYNGDPLDTFSDNIACAMEVAKELNLDLKRFEESLKDYKRDIGAFKAYKLGHTTFLNGLSINDSDSIKLMYEKILKDYKKERITILLNSRYDRPSRALSHINLLIELDPEKIILCGSSTEYILSELKKKLGSKVTVLKRLDDLKCEDVIFAIGNFHGYGRKVIDYFKEGEKDE